MDLSIIIVNWNTREILRNCLASCYDNFEGVSAEVILIDNASSDRSAEMVRRDFPKVKLIENRENRGFAAANNQGLSVCKGRHVLLLNSDTVVHGSVIRNTIEYLDAEPSIGVLTCRVLNDDGTIQPNTSRFPSLLNLTILLSGLWRLNGVPFFDRYRMTNWDRLDARDVEVVAGCYMAVRGSAIDEVGVLDEDFFFFGEETDWCVRFRQAGWRVHCAPVGEITHLGGESAKRLNFKRDILLTDATIKLHRKHYGKTSAVLAWLLLAVFNSSRYIFWKGCSVLTRKENARDRADHFLRVIVGMPKSI